MIRYSAFAIAASATLAALAPATPAQATGKMTCNSGPASGWKSMDALKAQLTKDGWQVRNAKVDGGCYEVYAIDDKGERVEAYFHPRTLAPVPTGAKGHKG